jgi:hypothetical protein
LFVVLHSTNVPNIPSFSGFTTSVVFSIVITPS